MVDRGSFRARDENELRGYGMGMTWWGRMSRTSLLCIYQPVWESPLGSTPTMPAQLGRRRITAIPWFFLPARDYIHHAISTATDGSECRGSETRAFQHMTRKQVMRRAGLI